MTTHPKLEKLKELAGRATPGPWRACITDENEHGPIYKIGSDDEDCELNHANDAAYVAAANPQTVQALVTVIEKQRAALQAIGVDSGENDPRIIGPVRYGLFVTSEAFVALAETEKLLEGI